MKNVIIKGVGKYIPSKVINRDFFISHFEKEENGGTNISGLLNSLGRDEFHLAEKGENSLTMGYQACLDVINKNNIDKQSIDMIVFVSTTPEYTAPTNALKLNAMLRANNAHTVYDMNCNCVGMLVALDTISKVMKCSDNINRALVVGSMYSSSVVRWNDPIAYPNFGDAATAVVLDKVEEDSPRGFVDSEYFTDSSYHDFIRLPACGHSNERMGKLHKYYRRLEWQQFDTDFVPIWWHEMISHLFSKNNISEEDVIFYLLSQFSDKYNRQTLNSIGNKSEDKYIFNANKYGYTACSSPILALYDVWSNLEGSQKYGYLVFCSVAAGSSATALLYKV